MASNDINGTVDQIRPAPRPFPIALAAWAAGYHRPGHVNYKKDSIGVLVDKFYARMDPASRFVFFDAWEAELSTLPKEVPSECVCGVCSGQED